MKQRWEILANLTNKNNYEIICEVGVNSGINSANWISLCPQIKKAYLIDKDPNDVFSLGEFKDRKIEHKIQYWTVGSEEGSKLTPNNLDIVFIDADHSYDAVRKDIDLWLPKIREGGILAGHDYIDYIEYGVKKAVDEYFNWNEVHLEDDVLENGELKIWWIKV